MIKSFAKNKIMIIGAGKFQLPAILKAKEMDLTVLATDKDPDAVGFQFADYPSVVDIKDVGENTNLARQHKVNGILSIVSELGVRTQAAVAQELGLPGLKTEAAFAVTNKARMREIFKKHRLPSPQFYIVRTRNEANKAIRSLGLPVVMKPTDNAGSRGVSKIDRLEDLDFSFELAKAHTLSGEIIVEKFMEGEEMTIEAISYRGEHEILAMSNKKRIPFPYCVSIDLTYSPPHEIKLQQEVRQLMKKALTVLGLDYGASHSEVMLTKSGPFLVEVAGRGGGFGIFSDIIPKISGVDIVKQCINIAMGYEVDIKVRYQKAAVLRFFTPPPGKILGISGLEEARFIPGVSKIELDVKVGDVLQPIRRDGERPGLMIVFGDDREEAVAKADLVEKTVKFRIEERK